MKRQIFHIFLLTILFFECTTNIYAQWHKDEYALINVDSLINANTNPVIFMQEVYVTPGDEFRTKKERRRHSRLIRNLKKAYPYAKLLSTTMNDIEKNLKSIPQDKAKKKYIKKREKEFRKTYEKDIRNLTISQGVLLMKLIDRETGTTSYDVIKEFKGGVLAGTYQAVARIFGHNLKLKYDARGEDKEIEILIIKLENGQL